MKQSKAAVAIAKRAVMPAKTQSVRVLASSAAQDQYGRPQGCTPGFWGNNLAPWPAAYSPSTTLGSVFGNVPAALAGKTFREALMFPGELGHAAKLLRHGVAALLNAVHPGVNYPLEPGAVIGMVTQALAGSATTMESTKNHLDALNNAGCPLSANGRS